MKKYQLTLLSLCVAAFAQAKVTLPSFFTDNMVIQQNSQLTLPGKAKAGKQVTVKVSWNHEKYTAKASADGHFSIEVPTPPAGGPYQIIVSDGEKLVLNNVLSGEVWICSGQSNMEMPVAGWGKVMNYEQEVADADYPSIRLLQVKKTVAFSPQDNVEMNMNGWQECSSATVPEFSSVAYFYARKLWKELNVPVLLLSQLNRGSDGRPFSRPILSDLRESGAIEQDADMVMLLYRPALSGIKTEPVSKYPTECLGVVMVAKHRNGETGDVYFAHNPSMTKLGEYVPPTEWLMRNAK